ncbi:hypothetical protein EC968_004109 [Mortierella alpina]|nr:hypothetical protein EC968_004109 [Mortierella alpina]
MAMAVSSRHLIFPTAILLHPSSNRPSMLLKAFCLCVSCVSYVVVWLPPASSKTASPKRDMIRDEGLLTRVNLTQLVPKVMPAATIFQTIVYIFLMIHGKGFGSYAVLQLQTFKVWHALAAVLALVGYVLRRWSFITLDRFFTYELTIRSGHRLIQTGPYKYLRHPSYTGALLNSAATYALIWRQGLWDVASFYILRSAAIVAFHLRLAGVPWINTASELLLDPFVATGSPLGLDPRIGAVMYSVMTLLIVLVRVKNEEAMLREHFGAEWDAYARQRWRLVPFVY